MAFLVNLMSGFGYFSVFFLIMFNLDILFYVVRVHLPSFPIWTFIARVIVTFISGQEIARVIAFIIVDCMIPLQIIVDLIAHFQTAKERLNQEEDNFRLRMLYVGLGVGINQCSELQGPITAALMAFGQSLIVVCNIATIKMWSVIPLPLYLIFPTLSVVIPIIVLILLPRASHCYERSMEQLKGWRLMVGLDEGRWKQEIKLGQQQEQRQRATTSMPRSTTVTRPTTTSSTIDVAQTLRVDTWTQIARAARRRSVGALRPYKIYAQVGGAKLYVAKRSTKTTFFYSCIDATVTGLVTFPEL